MAHFAKLDQNNVVENIIVVNNDVILENGIENENLGIKFCEELFGGRWIQTSYNGNIRKRYATIGKKYDPIADEFE